MAQLLTPKEVAQLFRVSIPTVRRWAFDGRLPGIKIGKMLRFHAGAVERALGQLAGDVQTSSVAARL